MNRSVVLIVPRPLEMRTGGSIYDRRMADGLRTQEWSVDIRDVCRDVGPVLASIPDGTITVVDGLVFSEQPEAIEQHAPRLRFVALVHLPLAAAPGLSAPAAVALEARERRSLARAIAVVVTGNSTLNTIGRYGVDARRVFIVQPGTDRAPIARGSSSDVVHLLSVGAVTYGKGHDLLIRALAGVSSPGWRLTCAGSFDRNPDTAERVRDLVKSCGLEKRIGFAGELDDADLAAAYDRADVFVLATRHETFGMAVAEAVAHGLPVVSTITGAIPQIADGAGLLVPPGDVDALTIALRRVVDDRDLRRSLAVAARAARQRLATWEDASARMSSVLEHIASDGWAAL